MYLHIRKVLVETYIFFQLISMTASFKTKHTQHGKAQQEQLT
jgi:hypothetical protein